MNYLLLDADVIIDLHEFGFWDGFVSQNEISVASTVIYAEALHYFDNSHNKIYIDLDSQLRDRRIKELSATPEDQKEIYDKFDEIYAPSFNPGERESITIISNAKDENLKFCTSDGPAIIILSMLQLEHRGISFENALKHSGIRTKNILQPKHLEKRFRKLVTEGKQNIISGKGFKKFKYF